MAGKIIEVKQILIQSCPIDNGMSFREVLASYYPSIEEQATITERVSWHVGYILGGLTNMSEASCLLIRAAVCKAVEIFASRIMMDEYLVRIYVCDPPVEDRSGLLYISWHHK